MFPSLLFQMIISTGSKGAFVLCQLSRHNYHLRKRVPPVCCWFCHFWLTTQVPFFISPTGFNATHLACVQKTSIRGSLLEALIILGTCSRAVINRGWGYTEYRFPLPEMSGDPLGKEAWQITSQPSGTCLECVYGIRDFPGWERIGIENRKSQGTVVLSWPLTNCITLMHLLQTKAS